MDAVNMDDVSVHIKVLINAERDELERERGAVNATLEGCVHLVFKRHDMDELFELLNRELTFDKWFSLDVQALHLSDSKEDFRLYFSRASNEDHVKNMLSTLPLSKENCWWMFHIQEQKESENLYCVQTPVSPRDV